MRRVREFVICAPSVLGAAGTKRFTEAEGNNEKWLKGSREGWEEDKSLHSSQENQLHDQQGREFATQQ